MLGLFLWFIIPAIMLGVGIVWWIIDGGYSMGGVMMTICAGIYLIIALLLLGIFWSTALSQIQSFNATKAMVQTENGNLSQIERAAIVTKAIEANSWLAESQYWANNPFTSIFWPDQIRQLKPIKG